MLFDYSNISTEKLPDELTASKEISLSVLRLDKIHQVVSGNKLFKLHHFLNQVNIASDKTILTFGGAYSNHLVATAFACKNYGIKSIGLVRGEKPANLSPTLLSCIEYGMQLEFISRNEYDKKETEYFLSYLKNTFRNCIIIPEGGYSTKGAEGAALIMNYIDDDTTHICCAIGTATTVAGLLLKADEHQQIIGIPVLKGMNDIADRIFYLIQKKINRQQLHIHTDYHFGGYAKHTPELFTFMNALYNEYNIPTDFVYTGKMMFAVFDLIKKGYFPPGSKVVCLHTGGLQGNLSLPGGTLTF